MNQLGSAGTRPERPMVRTTGSALPVSRTIASLWETIGPPVPWEQLLTWPPDVFAFTDQLLVQSGAYRFVASPPAGAAWPPHDRWAGEVRAAGTGWSEAARLGTAGPGALLDRWETLTKAREVPLADLARGDPWTVCEAIITLHALADEACSSLNAFHGGDGTGFAERAWAMLEREGSLSRFPLSQIRVLPKTHVLPAELRFDPWRATSPPTPRRWT